MKIKIVTPEGLTYETEDAVSMTIPTKNGVITIMDDHIPLLTLLTPGEIVVRPEKGEVESLSVSKGVLDIRRESVIYILADTAERAHEIDIERAEQARKDAEEYLKKQEDIASAMDVAMLQAKIEKELARVSVGRKYKNVGGSSD